ncbi:MAG: S1 RNA-binding domain-containing protein [Caldilineales bacterium]|nr:S1 RNA-binding domain-containing protein [Caldilineales bacterium]
MNNLEPLSDSTTQEVNPALLNEPNDANTEQQEIHPMELLLNEDTFNFKELEVGEMIEGVIVGINDNEILVDIGSKSEGVIPARDLDRVDEEIREDLQLGKSIFIQVVRPEDREGHALLSLSRALQEYDWKHAEELLESQEIFEGEVSGFNKGGVIVFLGKARGFVPASQLVSDEGRKRDDSDDRFSELVGNNLYLKVIEIDRSRNRLILSERQAERERRRVQKAKLLNDLQVGEVRTGVISSIANFGAFVDLGGADGLVHLSELSWGRIQDPSEVVEIGQEVEVRIISVDRDRRRIGLSLRQLQPEPWTVVHENYAIGQLVEAEITRITSFGAFARVDGMIEGLIHVSELSERRINHPKEVVHEGQKLTLRIIKIEPEKRRMGLSLKRVAEEEYAVVSWSEDEIDEESDYDYDDDELETTAMAEALAAAEEASAMAVEATGLSEAEVLEAEVEVEEVVAETDEGEVVIAEVRVEEIVAGVNEEGEEVVEVVESVADVVASENDDEIVIEESVEAEALVNS